MGIGFKIWAVHLRPNQIQVPFPPDSVATVQQNPLNQN